MVNRSNTKNRQAFLNGVWLGMSVDRAFEDARQRMFANERAGEFCDCAMQDAYNRAAQRLARLEAAYPDRGMV